MLRAVGSESTQSNLWVVLNFSEELKRLAPN